MADNRDKSQSGKKPDRKASAPTGEVDQFVERQARLKPPAKPQFPVFGPRPKSGKPASRRGLEFELRRTAALAALHELFPIDRNAASNEKIKYDEISKGLNYPLDVSESEFIQSVSKTFELYAEQAQLSDEDKLALAAKIAKKLASESRKNGVLPTEAPALWAERSSGRDVSPADFIVEHYGNWFEYGLTRQHLKRIDPKLYQAFATWMRRHDVPPHLAEFAKSKKSAVDDELKAEGIAEPGDAFKKFPQDQAKAQRLYQAAKRRR
ncbi:MAG TPA: hypothetical protein VGO22_22930 [Pseudorhizobium sp.]|jgi:hypothetical protein|nr:hypothetical protein [Pseudorhizobium sp.]